MSHFRIKCFILLWKKNSNLIYQINCIRNLRIIRHLNGIITCYFSLYDPHTSPDIISIRLFSKWNTICIIKKSSTRNIFKCFYINQSIGNKNYLSREPCNLCIIEGNLFYESFICYSRLHLDSYNFTNFKCSRKQNRKTTKKIGNNITTRNRKQNSSNTSTSKNTGSINMKTI